MAYELKTYAFTKNQVVLLWMDNTTATAYMKKQGGMKICSFLWEVEPIMFLAQPMLLNNSTPFFSEPLNTPADYLFQHILDNKWFLLEEVFFQIQKIIRNY